MTGVPVERPPGTASAGGAGGTVVPFRRRPDRPRRKRRSLWLTLARPLATALLLVGAPLGLGAWVLTSPRFALAEIAVEGTGRVSAPWLEATLAPLQGRNLVRLPLAAVAARLELHPWIASFEMAKELPDRLRIRVEERRPAVFLKRGGRLFWADRAGRAIAPVEPAALKRRPLLVVSLADPAPGGVVRALEVAGELGRANPNWAGHLTEIEVLGEEDFRLHTGALPFPLLVRSGSVVAKARRLEALLPQLGRRYAALAAVDLRFSRRIVVQPAAPRAPEAGAGV